MTHDYKRNGTTTLFVAWTDRQSRARLAPIFRWRAMFCSRSTSPEIWTAAVTFWPSCATALCRWRRTLNRVLLLAPQCGARCGWSTPTRFSRSDYAPDTRRGGGA